ncbi:MAG: hypothetical protein EON58_02005 [Alphaproteobacteria bacterium]|nr:MAG: hypothetical protein EON58_02005 [Alphaproteobacteria bacterium]
MAHTVGSVSLFTVGGVNVLGDFDNAAINVEETQVNGAPLASGYSNAQGTKLSGTLKVAVFSNAMSGANAILRTSALNVSALEIEDENHLGVVRSFSVALAYAKQMRAGVGSRWTRPQIVTATASVESTLDVEDGVLSTLYSLLPGAGNADALTTFEATIGGTSLALPMRVRSIGTPYERDGIQTASVAMASGGPIYTGSTPASPLGAGSLLSKAFDPAYFDSSLAFAFTARPGAGSGSWTGALKFDSVRIAVEDETLIKTEYGFINDGAWTFTPG